MFACVRKERANRGAVFVGIPYDRPLSDFPLPTNKSGIGNTRRLGAIKRGLCTSRESMSRQREVTLVDRLCAYELEPGLFSL